MLAWPEEVCLPGLSACGGSKTATGDKAKETEGYRRAYYEKYEKTKEARTLKQYREQTEPEMHAAEHTVTTMPQLTITQDSLDNCRERVHHLLGIH